MGILTEDFHQNRTKLIKTAILCFAYVTLGYGIAIIGPTMLDLSYLVNSTVSSLTYLLATRAIGTLTSCLLTEYHKKYLSFEKILAISQFIMGISLFILPFFDLIWMNVVIFIYGYAAGCFQVFGDLWTISIWNKRKAAFYIQWIYFFFSLGALVAPLLAAPFLAPASKIDDPTNDFNDWSKELQNQTETNRNETNLNSTSVVDLDDENLTIKHTIKDLKVMYPYMISGIYAIIISVILYVFDFVSNDDGKVRSDGYKAIDYDDEIDNQLDNEKAKNDFHTNKLVASAEAVSKAGDEKSALLAKKASRKEYSESSSTSLANSFEVTSPSLMPNFVLIKILSVLFINLFIGFDVSFGTYLSVWVFVNDDFALSTQQGAILTAAFWFAYTFLFRLPGFFIIKSYGPSILMNIEMIITFFSTILLSFLIFSNSIVLLWMSVLLEGIGMSIVYSTYLAYLKTKFEPSAKLCSAFVCSFCFGSFVYPTIIGIYIEQYPIIFIYISIFLCFATTFIYVYVRYLFRKWK